MNAEQERAADEVAIRVLLAERAAAFRARDASRFVTSLDPSIVIFDLAPPLRRTGPELLDPQHHRPARQLDQPGHNAGHRMVVIRVAAGGQPGPPPDRHPPHPPVQRPHAGLRPAQIAPDPRSVHGPGRSSSAAIRRVSRRPPSGGRPHRGRPASPPPPRC